MSFYVESDGDRVPKDVYICKDGQRLVTMECENEQTRFRLARRICALLNGSDDMSQCGVCGDWFKDKDTVRANERCACHHCYRWDYFLREDDDRETIDHYFPSFIKAIRGTKFWDELPRETRGKHKGRLVEPFLTAHKECVRRAGL